MALLRRTPKSPEPDRESRASMPAPEVIGWRVPPMGSLGDAWDEAIELPEAPDAGAAEAEAKARAARKRRKRRSPKEIVFLEFMPPLHAGIIVAWVALACAAFTTGPAYPLMVYWALLGTLAAAIGLGLLYTIHRDQQGTKSGWIALSLGMLMLTIDAAHPRGENVWTTHFEGTGAAPLASLSLDGKLEIAEKSMALMAQVAFCASKVLANETLGVGRSGINNRVREGSAYFRISTLVDPTPLDLTEFERDSYVYYAHDFVPRDPFADDRAATFGVYFTSNHIIVYSMGPDGQWDIDPLQPVDHRDPDPITTLAPFLYVDGTGPSGPGDLVHVISREELDPEVLTFWGPGFADDCPQVKTALRELLRQ